MTEEQYDGFIRAMHGARTILKQIWGDTYAFKIDQHIQLVRKVMADKHVSAGKAAAFIINNADEKTAWPFAAALEIAEQDAFKPELN